MRILIASETLVVGGAETFAVRLANELSLAHEVVLFVFHGNMIKKELFDKISPSVKVVVPAFSIKRLKQKSDSLLYKAGIDYSFIQAELEKKAKKVLEDFQPQVVHTHLLKVDYLFAKLKAKYHYTYKHITTIHGDYSSFYHKEANARLLDLPAKISFTLHQLSTVVCLCQEHLQFFKSNFPKETDNKLQIIYNGFKPFSSDFKSISKEQLGLPNESFIYGMVSRGVPKKGWEKAILSFKEANLINSTLVLVGWSDYMAELKQKYSADKNIIFAGFSSNPIEYIQHFDVCLLPTLFHYESLPTVVIEYLFCCKPVIASNVGEISNMIAGDGERAGLLLSFNNQDISIYEMAEAMRRIKGQEEKYNEMKRVAAKAFKKFDMGQCTKEYENIYGESESDAE